MAVAPHGYGVTVPAGDRAAWRYRRVRQKRPCELGGQRTDGRAGDIPGAMPAKAASEAPAPSAGSLEFARCAAYPSFSTLAKSSSTGVDRPKIVTETFNRL